MPSPPDLALLPSPLRRVRTVRSPAAHRGLLRAWRTLEADARHIPLSVEVLRASGQFSGRQDLRTIVIDDARGLLAVWPLVVDHIGPARVARRLGGPLQAYDGITMARRAPLRGLEELAWAELRRWTDVDVLKLDAVVVGDPLLQTSGLAPWITSAQRTGRIRLQAGTDLLASKSKQRRKAVRRRRRQLEKQGTVTVRRLVSPSDREHALLQAIRTKLAWLDAQGAPSPVLRSRAFQEGLRATMIVDAAQSRMEVFQLELDGRGIAWEIGHVDGDSFRSFIGAYHPDFGRLGVGVTLTLETVRWCAAQGLRIYDFLPPSTEFKQSWSDHERAVSRVVCPLRPRGRLLVPAVREGRQLAKRAWNRFVPSELAKAILAS